MTVKRWTKEEVEEVSRMHAEGRSFSEIGIALGRTTNSIAGKLDRLGLLKSRVLRDKIYKEPEKNTSKKVKTKGVKLIDATPKQCRFMDVAISEKTEYVCGKPVYKGSWCEECYKKVFQHKSNGLPLLKKVR